MINLKNYNFIRLLQAFAGVVSAILITIIFVLVLGKNINSYFGAVVAFIMAIFGGYRLNKSDTLYLESLFFGLLIVGEIIFIGLLTFEIFKFDFDKLFLYSFSLVIFAISYYFVKLPIYRYFASFIIFVSLYNISLLYGVLPIYYSFIMVLLAYLFVKDLKNFIELKYAFLVSFLFTPIGGYVFSYGIDKFMKYNLIANYSNILYFIAIFLSYLIVLREFRFKLQEITSILLFASIVLMTYIEPFHLMFPLLVLLIGFYKENWSLKILSILSFIYSIYIYNYSTIITFLDKSKDLAIFGIVLILIAFGLNIYKKRLHNV